MSKRRRTKPRARPTPAATGSVPALASGTSPAATRSAPTPVSKKTPAALQEPEGAPTPLDPAQIRYLLGAVVAGVLDEHLATVSVAIAHRHQQLVRIEANRAAARIRLGDRVRINHAIRPLYLRGATGTVVDWIGQRAVVQLDRPAGRFSTGEIRCPPLGLDHLLRAEQLPCDNPPDPGSTEQ
ncbi:hypothetical protein [Arthrobacter sp. H14-L1]|uniref:hypothetical protein n=1 Tax=Arthrobacter sp. H14-L1 TaxID=2996697 RepID=UPI00227145A4|nr:hypothetical protein [Arthrobacter sp. H14-L1]MCY0906321.1 hypothetical protein [Arthrobacter sp. H14-L1]